jgi:hypothetical protein
VINNSIKQGFTEYLKAYPGIDNNPEYYVFFNTKTNVYAEPIKRGHKPGNSSLPSARKLDCREIMVLTVCERPRVTMPV